MIIADNKWFTRVVTAAVSQTLDSLRLKYPEVGPDKLKGLAAARTELVKGVGASSDGRRRHHLRANH